MHYDQWKYCIALHDGIIALVGMIETSISAIGH